MHPGRILERPERGKIAAATEGAAVPCKHQIQDCGAKQAASNHLEQRRTRIGGECGVPLRTIERHAQEIDIAVRHHRI
jgi:hypothetical protein